MMDIHLMINDRLDRHNKVNDIAKRIASRYGKSFEDAFEMVTQIQKDRRKIGLKY